MSAERVANFCPRCGHETGGDDAAFGGHHMAFQRGAGAVGNDRRAVGGADLHDAHDLFNGLGEGNRVGLHAQQ